MPKTVLLETHTSGNCSAAVAAVSSNTMNTPPREIKILFNLKRTQQNSTLDHNQYHHSRTTKPSKLTTKIALNVNRMYVYMEFNHGQ